MRNQVFILMMCLAGTIQLFGQPTDNPVRNYYGNGNYPVWTDNIKWHHVIDMSEYTNGANDFEKFENARDQIANQGGGVLYYPAGVYDFSDMPADGPTGRGLMLRENVVIRGATPSGDANASDGTLDLPTKFVMGFDTVAPGKVKPRDWNFVGLMPEEGDSVKHVDNVGVAWIHFQGAGIYFGANYKTYSTFDSVPPVSDEEHKLHFLRLECWWCKIKDAWRDISLVDATHPVHPYYMQPQKTVYKGAGDGRLVFGCLMEDAALTTSGMDYGAGEDSYYTAKVAGRVGVYGSNVLIANNAIPKSDKTFAYQQETCQVDQSDKYNTCLERPISTLLFDYGKMVGIEVNKSANGGGAFWEYPGFYNWPRFWEEENVIVQDNYVFNHGHKGYNISGKWIRIKNNHNERAYLQEGDDIYGLGVDWELTRDGYIHSEPGGSGKVSDNKSRAFDLGGKNLWADSNTYNNLGSDPGNDGEGMLCQAFSGTIIYSWALTHNHHFGGAENGSIGGYDVNQYGSFMAWNTTPGWVGSEKNGANIDAAYVDNDAGSIRTTGSDVITSCPSGTPNPPQNVAVAVSEDSTYAEISWEDHSDNEIAFRIDKRMGNSGNWQTLVYRPRQSSGHSENPQIWRDYMIPRDTRTYYRVVAINCNDSDEGASDPVGPVGLNEVVTHSKQVKTQTGSSNITVSPNPTPGKVYINGIHSEIKVEVYTTNGKKIYKTKTSKVVDLSGLSNGIYVLKLKDQAVKVVKK